MGGSLIGSWFSLDMISILNSGSEPQFLDQLPEWLELEWGESDRSDGDDAPCNVPVPLLAVDDEHLLVGGIAFTSHPEPGSHELGIWINALIVSEPFRGRGIGSKLVRAAELEANRQWIPELFVYTNVPILYQKLGWWLVKHDDGNSVLVKAVAEHRS